MDFRRMLLSLGLLAGAYAIPAVDSHNQSSIQWGPCSIESPLDTQCANLTVPRDYTQPNSSATVQLELLKVPAVKGPSKGSILFNFGGPGVPTQSNLASRAELYQA